MIAFGPISSRRLGLSLGINNIVSHKVCSYNCVYCQVGNTKHKSAERQIFYEPSILVNTIKDHLKKLNSNHIPDYLTFVANGEPTLDINLGKEIRLLKKLNIPVAVISNASLIHHPEVQEDLMEADWISLKVDTVSESAWERINRPVREIDLNEILQGLIVFSALYKGELHTETMLIKDYNDSHGQLKDTASFISLLKPQKAYLSIPTRPPALKEVKAVPEEKIAEAWQIYQQEGINTELLTGFEETNTGFTGNAFEDILNITAVHPLRDDTMNELLKQDKADNNVVKSLIKQGLIKKSTYNGKTYYVRKYHF
ncbi:MAG: radical SAM protein [Bacteroidales bacterium]|nr:radical SAM protein [Bacteroidales bacterium]